MCVSLENTLQEKKIENNQHNEKSERHGYGGGRVAGVFVVEYGMTHEAVLHVDLVVTTEAVEYGSGFDTSP